VEDRRAVGGALGLRVAQVAASVRKRLVDPTIGAIL
jgi:hypothetical protein